MSDRSGGRTRSVLLVVGNRAVAAVTSIALLVMVTRGLSDPAAAVYFYVQSLQLVLGALGRFGVPRTAVREVAAARSRYGQAQGVIVADRASSLNLITTTVAAVVLGAVVAARIGSTEVTLLVVALAGVWLYLEIRRSFWVEVIRGWGRVGESAVLGEGSRNLVVLGGAGALLAADRLTLVTVLVLHVMASALLAVTARVRARPKGALMTEPVVADIPTRRDLAGSGFHVALAEGFGVWLAQGPVVIAGLFLTDALVTDVAVAVRLSQLLTLPLMVTNQYFMPAVARAHAEGRLAVVERRVRTAASLALLAGLVAGVALLLASGPITRALAAGHDAPGLLAALVFGQVVSLGCGPCAGVLQMTGHQRVVAILNGVAAVVFTGVGLLVAAGDSALGLVMATAIALAASNIALVLVVFREHGMRTYAASRLLAPAALRATAGGPDTSTRSEHA